jgi:adenosylcobinamide-phosphate synthase
MIHAAVILFVAFLLDLLLGDPPYRFHPVRLIGLCVSFLEKLLLRARLSGSAGGVFLAAGVVGLTIGVYLAIRFVLNGLHPWTATILDLYLTYSCLALTDLLKHASTVAEALVRNDLPQGRAALQKIVGRDTGSLNPAAVARGAVESAAENFVDGVLSPLFWYTFGALLCQILQCPTPTVAGVFAILSFKAISTLDSMVGYRHAHYLAFGRAAARLDDLANLIPARLSLAILFGGALISGERAGAGWQVAMRDRLKHLSPNAGHSESFVAGALGIRLGGPTTYKETTVDKPWLGDGDDEVGPDHIRRCCRLIYRSSWLSVLLFSIGLLSPSLILR